MKKRSLLIFLFCFLTIIFYQFANACVCERKVAVYGVSKTDPSFNSTSAASWMQSQLGSDCVTFAPYGQVKEPEYIISLRYEMAEDGRFWWLDESLGKIDPIYICDGPISHAQSTISMGIFYVAGNNEKRSGGFNSDGGRVDIQSFDYSSYLYGPGINGCHMDLERLKQEFANQYLSPIKPFNKYLWRWEQVPFEVEVKKKPNREELNPGETVMITLDSYKDFEGKKVKSRANLRLKMKADKGKIRDGESGSPYWVDEEVRVYQGEYSWRNKIKVKYLAPSFPEGCQEDTEDTIRIFNSCDIKTWDTPSPLDKTECKEEIKIIKFKIKCPRGQAYFTTKIIEHFVDEGEFKDNKGNKKGSRKRAYTKERRITVSGDFVEQGVIPMPGSFGVMYMVNNSRVISHNLTHQDIFDSVLKGKKGDSTVHQSTIGTLMGNPTLATPPMPFPMILMYEDETRKKLVNVQLPGYQAVFDWKWREKLKVVNNGEVKQDEDKVRDRKEDLTIGRVKSGPFVDWKITGNVVTGKEIIRKEIKEETQGNGWKIGFIEKLYRFEVFLKNLAPK